MPAGPVKWGSNVALRTHSALRARRATQAQRKPTAPHGVARTRLAALIGGAALIGTVLAATPAMASSISGWSPTVSRVAGADRYATSVQVAEDGFPNSAPVVYVATGTNFPDALSAAAAAAVSGGPLLLTSPTSLPVSVRTEIEALHPTTIKVIGGTSAVSPSVFSDLSSLAPSVVRLSGADRYSTGRAVVEDAFPSGSSQVYIATGQNFPDALSASAAAGSQGDPVVLVNGSASQLDPATTQLLQSLHATSFVIAGGTAAVSGGISEDLSALGSVVRYSGSDRFATSAAIDQAIFPDASHVYLATGDQFPDALSGAALAASQDSPLYVVEPDCLPDATETDLASGGASSVTLIGGTGALTAQVGSLDNCSSIAPPPSAPPSTPPGSGIIRNIVPGAFCPDADYLRTGESASGKYYVCGYKGKDDSGHYHWNTT